MNTLFQNDEYRPLADRLRPTKIEDVVGQEHLLAANAPLGRMIKSGKLVSFILWGPAGCGKTTIARLMAHYTDMEFVPISAVFSGVADLRKVFADAEERQKMGKGTLLFVDEIHRFNRSQQDGFLPYVEKGTVVLVGATTENPSFELNAALLSRCQLFILNRLDDGSLEQIIKQQKRKEEIEQIKKENEIKLVSGVFYSWPGKEEKIFKHLEKLIKNNNVKNIKIYIAFNNDNKDNIISISLWFD